MTTTILKQYANTIYQIDSSGKVINSRTDYELKQRLVQGYPFVTLKINGKSKPHSIHGLLMKTFKDPPPEDGQIYSVDHIDRNKENFDLDNLRWATGSQQSINSTKGEKKGLRRSITLTCMKTQREIVFETMALAIEFISPKLHSASNIAYKALREKTACYGYYWSYTVTLCDHASAKDIPAEFINGSIGYQATSDGYIIFPDGRATKGTDGEYLAVNIQKKEYRVNRLVAAAFKGVKENKIVNHIDGNKHNNSIDNLEWVTHKENSIHSYAIGLSKTPIGRTVMKLSLENEFIATFISIGEAAREVKGHYTNIVACCNGRQKTAYGFKWKYGIEDE